MIEKVKKEDLSVGEYERLVYPSVYDYLTKGNKPSNQHYYRTDDGNVWEVSCFDNEKSSELGRRLDVLEYLSKKINIAEALGVI